VNLILTRDYSDARCTLGRLSVGTLELQTLELPWEPLPNVPYGRPDRSCVPEGLYALELHDSPRHPHTFALVNPALGIYHDNSSIPAGGGRCEVLIHPANVTAELQGCIAVGRRREKFSTGEWWISLSDDAFAALQNAVPWTAGNTLIVVGDSV
jgi:hypothetical protein